MDYNINENKKQTVIEHPIADCTHLIDLPAVTTVFNHKVKENSINHPKACIKILTAFFNKNGLANLL
ncbi:hypothetical protein [Pedobacter miscanthi]|jgi:hypothetical protein|uniref:hypothetical protein n=1 Tax=Pedobacter miscanthi TaxID=2259170 RepID=UPI00292D995B|nr:hypothetical protein [Pedobacter miscanthi]